MFSAPAINEHTTLKGFSSYNFCFYMTAKLAHDSYFNVNAWLTWRLFREDKDVDQSTQTKHNIERTRCFWIYLCSIHLPDDILGCLTWTFVLLKYLLSIVRKCVIKTCPEIYIYIYIRMYVLTYEQSSRVLESCQH